MSGERVSQSVQTTPTQFAKNLILTIVSPRMREGLGGDIRKREREEVTVKLGAKQFKLRSGRKQKERQWIVSIEKT